MKDRATDPLKHLKDLELRLADQLGPAGLWITSLAWPRAALRGLSLEGRQTWTSPLGRWPGTAAMPRRLLMVADGGGESAPRAVALTASADAPLDEPPTASAECFAVCDEPGFMWERHLLRLSWGRGEGRRSIGLAMGLRHAGEVHWWECCRLVELESTPTCRVVEMGGAIPCDSAGFSQLTDYGAFDNPYLHKHNWLNGRLYARLHANGVCEVFAHHINSRFFDDGLGLDDVVPVIGFHVDENAPAGIPEGEWDGSRSALTLAGVQLDLTETSRLATPKYPGRLDHDDEHGFMVYQPYAGVELFGGDCPRARTGDPFIFRPEQRLFPRGMARTLRLSLSLNPQRPPRVARYLAPAWWYGLCEEFSPAALLPADDPADDTLEVVRSRLAERTVRGGFEDGAVPRHLDPCPAEDAHGRPTRHEAGWEGEIPYGRFLTAWRFTDAEGYADALRGAYYFTDVAVDHAAKAVRMHGFLPPATSLPMARVQGTIAAYLETGDPYLLDTAEAIVESAYRTQMNSWPRLAVGRDACFARSAVMLYRYFADEHFRKIAHDSAQMVVASQRSNGTFGDQAGGTGIHQWGAYITKPWMGLLSLGGVLDYLELFPDEQAMADSVRRFADWLMSARVRHEAGVGWSYQHDFNGQPRHFDIYRGGWVDLPSPNPWHHETLARLLGWCAIRFGEPAYLRAWAQSHSIAPVPGSDHPFAAAMQFLPWLYDRLWNATPSGNGVDLEPIDFGELTPTAARIDAPSGPVNVQRETAAVAEAARRTPIPTA